jgi:uncharacterized membrane protein YhhN
MSLQGDSKIMSMLRRAWFVASVVVALAAVVVALAAVVDALEMSNPVALPVGAIVIVIGFMPLALLLASAPERRRAAGVLHIGAGALFGITGIVMASQDNFLQLRLASIDWRILARSGLGLAPVGWVAIGVALALTGTALLRSRRGLALLSSLLVILTAGYLAVSLVVVPYLYLRRHGTVRLDWPLVVVAIVLLLVALLQLIAALSRVPVEWKRTIPDQPVSPLALNDDASRAHPTIKVHAMGRWAKPMVWSTVGVAAVTGVFVWGWSIFGPRLVLAEVFPDSCDSSSGAVSHCPGILTN